MKQTYMRIIAVAGLGAAMAFGAASQSSAQLTLVTSRPAFDTLGFDTVDWGQLGGSFTVVGSPFGALSAGLNTLTVSDAGATFERRDQGSGWSGNFASGDKVIWTKGNNGPMTIAFLNAVGGVGYQIQSDFFGPFVANLEAFDGANNSIGSVSESGNSAFTGDNSAIFIGGTSPTAIAKVVISLTSAPSNMTADFAINRLDTVGSNSNVPEPGTFAMLGGMLVSGFGLVGRRRRA